MMILLKIYKILIFSFFFYFKASFYIYFCISARFRQQFIYVFLNHHLQIWHKNITQVAPQNNLRNINSINIENTHTEL